MLASFFDPTHKQIVLNKKIIALSAKVDSLTTEMEQKAAFTDLVQRVISGKDEELKSESPTPVKTVKVDEINQLSVVDSLFRKEFEKKRIECFFRQKCFFWKIVQLNTF
ncbi:MAG: hypothetical protein NVV82_01435 [Sporocytophaga sp.]|nr:hypothetical protein [Sporocytophaga sp.]